MPRKLKPAAPAPRALPPVPKELIDRFVKGPMTSDAVQTASAAFKKAMIERALSTELAHHLGHPAGAGRLRKRPTRAAAREARQYSPTTPRYASRFDATAMAASSHPNNQTHAPFHGL